MNQFLRFCSAFLMLLTFSCADLPIIGGLFEEEDDNRNELIALLILLSNSGSSGARSCGGYPGERSGETSVTQGSSTYTTGYSQVSSNNQDAYVFKETGGSLDWCYYYDGSVDDSRGVAIAADSSNLYVAFTCTGGNTTFKGTDGAFRTSYGQGGGAKVTFLARISQSTGDIQAATFLISKLSNGNTNSLYPADSNSLTIGTGTVTLKANHAAHPAREGIVGNNETNCVLADYDSDTTKIINITMNQDMSLNSADCE